jgi:hypothetical protein
MAAAFPKVPLPCSADFLTTMLLALGRRALSGAADVSIAAAQPCAITKLPHASKQIVMFMYTASHVQASLARPPQPALSAF